MAYKFSKPYAARGNFSPYTDEENPRAMLKKSALYLADAHWKELGEPEYLVTRVDSHNKAFKLEVVPHGVGYAVGHEQKANGQWIHVTFRTSHNPEHRRRGAAHAFKDLPLGVYKPMGGGIFEYDPTDPYNKSASDR